MKQKSGPAKEPAAAVVKGIRRATRRQFSAEEKIRIVLEGLRGEESIAELCRRENIAETIIHRKRDRIRPHSALGGTPPVPMSGRNHLLCREPSTVAARLPKEKAARVYRVALSPGRKRPRRAGGVNHISPVRCVAAPQQWLCLIVPRRTILWIRDLRSMAPCGPGREDCRRGRESRYCRAGASPRRW